MNHEQRTNIADEMPFDLCATFGCAPQIIAVEGQEFQCLSTLVRFASIYGSRGWGIGGTGSMADQPGGDGSLRYEVQWLHRRLHLNGSLNLATVGHCMCNRGAPLAESLLRHSSRQRSPRGRSPPHGYENPTIRARWHHANLRRS